MLYLGGVYEKEKNYIEAEKYYLKVTNDYKKSPVSYEALLSLGHLFWSKGNLNKAQGYFEQLAKNDTSLALKAKLYLAKIFTQGKEYDKALEIYDQLSERDSAIAQAALIDKAFLLKEMKDYQQAAIIFRKVLDGDANTPEMRFSLGFCLERIGRYDNAIEEYLNVIYGYKNEDNTLGEEYQNYKIKAYFRIAKIYERNGNISEARNTYKKIIKLGAKEARIAQLRLDELKQE